MVDIESLVTREIEDLHVFFVSWFSGSAPDDDAWFQDEFTDRFHLSFVLIPPGGNMLDLGTLTSSIRSRHGSNPDFRIAIRNVKVRLCWENYVLATYEEWQRNALASKPPDNGRLASVLFQNGDSLKWLHVHETWLPVEVMAAGPYDF